MAPSASRFPAAARQRWPGSLFNAMPRGWNASFSGFRPNPGNRRHGRLGRRFSCAATRSALKPGLNGEAKKIENPPSSGCGATSEDDTIRDAETVRFGSESVRGPGPAADLRPAIEDHLRKLATRELPPRVLELAARHGLTVRRVTVRSQKSRWGSCSRRGTISLNWRLIQTPAFVSDYICLHELMHLRQMNHSPGFWREMERVCPDYRMAERWLKEHSGLLR